jgi:DNA polymerase III alpha subunit
MLLNCHSFFSLRYGMIPEHQLLKMGHENGYGSIALTDINNTSGCLNFIREAREYNIKPIVGIDFRNGNQQQYVGLAKNNIGFQELNDFLSKHLHKKDPFPEQAPLLENAIFIYPFEKLSRTHWCFHKRSDQDPVFSLRKIHRQARHYAAAHFPQQKGFQCTPAAQICR